MYFEIALDDVDLFVYIYIYIDVSEIINISLYRETYRYREKKEEDKIFDFNKELLLVCKRSARCILQKMNQLD